jgi:hypothetical protein
LASRLRCSSGFVQQVSVDLGGSPYIATNQTKSLHASSGSERAVAPLLSDRQRWTQSLNTLQVNAGRSDDGGHGSGDTYCVVVGGEWSATGADGTDSGCAWPAGTGPSPS